MKVTRDVRGNKCEFIVEGVLTFLGHDRGRGAVARADAVVAQGGGYSGTAKLS